MLAAALVVLAGIAFLSQTLRDRKASSPGKPVFPALAADKADAIEIKTKDKTVRLRKQGETWLVETEGNHLADPKLMKQVTSALEGVRTATLISASPAKQASFEVDSTGMEVKVLQGSKTVAAFVVGKPGSDWLSSFIRPANEQKVYQVPVYLRSVFDRGGDTWRKQTLLDVLPEDITGMTIRCAKGNYTIEKDAAGAWQITDPVKAPINPEMMPVLLRCAGQIRSTAFADSSLDLATMGLSPDTTSLVVRAADGKSYTILVGGTQERNQSYTKMQDDPTVYLVPRGRWNTVFRPMDELKAETGSTPSAVPVQEPKLRGAIPG